MKPSWKPSRWLGTKNFRIEPKPESPAAGFAKVLHPSDNSARSGSYAWAQQGRGYALLSPAQLGRARFSKSCPRFFDAPAHPYPTETAADSSTCASRRNFAASSGGVGLM